MKIKSKNFAGVFLLSISIGLAGLTACTKKQAPTPEAETSSTPPKDYTGQTLQIYTWSNYINPDVIKKFEESTKAKVQLNYFSSNEELLAKLQAGARGYDVIIPSGYLVRALKELQLVEPLGALNWPEFGSLANRFKAPEFDPKFEYAVPYAWGTTGISVNRDRLKDTVDSWAWVFDKEKLAKLNKKVTLLDDAPAVVGAALKYLGYPYNESSVEAFAKVKKLLVDNKKWIKAYTSEPIPLLENGEVAIAQTYSGDSLQVIYKKKKNLEYVMPKEGGEIFVDCLMIPKGAKSPELAKAFLRYTLSQSVALAQTQHIYYSPVVNLMGMPEATDLLKNPVIFPSDAQLQKWEMMIDDPVRMEQIQKLWTELKSS